MFPNYYLRQGGCVFVVRLSLLYQLDLFVCLSVRLLVTLPKNFQTDLHEIFKEGWQWANDQAIKFCWRSAPSSSGYRDCFPNSSVLEDTSDILVIEIILVIVIVSFCLIILVII